METLINYIKSNNIIALQQELEGKDINMLDDRDNTLLHYSIKYQKYEISYFLLNKGINLNVINIYGMTPLSLAVKLNLLNIVQALIDNNANPLIYDSKLEDAIYYAYKYGRENIISYFENKFNYDYNKSNKFGENLLFALISSHNIKLVKKYINVNNIYSKDYANNTLIMKAVKVDDIKIARYLLELTTANVNMFNNERLVPISYALLNKNKDMIKLLLTHGALTEFYFNNINYKEDIISIDKSLLDYDMTNEYQLKYKLIYYMLQNDITMFSKNVNYNNVYIMNESNKNIIDYIKLYKYNNKNNKFYQVLCHLDKKLI